MGHAEQIQKVFSDLSEFLEFFVNLQSVKWGLIGVAFAIFKFKRDGRSGVFKFWYEMAFIFWVIYIIAPLAILNGLPENYLPILAAVIGYSGVNNIVKVAGKFVNIWLEYIVNKYTKKSLKPSDGLIEKGKEKANQKKDE